MIISTVAFLLLAGEHTSPFPATDYRLQQTYRNDFLPTDWEGVIDTEPMADDSPWDAPYIVVEGASWSAHSLASMDYQRSNFRVLQTEHTDGTFLVETWRGDAGELRIPLWIEEDEHPENGIHRDVDAARAFIATMDEMSYGDSPLLDQDDHDALREELTEEAWDGWLRWDAVAVARQEVARIIGEDTMNADGQQTYDALVDSFDVDTTLREAFWSAWSELAEPYGFYVEFESADSVIIPEWESAARELGRRIASGELTLPVSA